MLSENIVFKTKIKESRNWRYQELKIKELDEKTINKIIDRVLEIYTYENLSIKESIKKAKTEFKIEEEVVENIFKNKFKNIKLGE